MAKEILDTNSKLTFYFFLDIKRKLVSSNVILFSGCGLTARTADSKSARVGSTPTAPAISF